LMRAVAGEEQMRVGIDQARRKQVALRVDRLVSRRRARGGPDVDDAIALAGDRAVLDQTQRRLAFRRLRAGHGGDARAMDQQEAPFTALTSAFSTGQSAIASDPSFIASVSRFGEATLPQSR